MTPEDAVGNHNDRNSVILSLITMLPDVESLRCFEAGARLLNFRAAARSVALSPAAFGERIKRLEHTLDARLFDRTTRRVTLTPAGERLLAQARRCLHEASQCAAVVHASNRAGRFDLTIGTRYELGMSWLVPALDMLEQQQPERRLHMVFGNTATLLTALHRSEIDCLVSSARMTDAGLCYARLHEESYVFVGSAALLAQQPLLRCQHASEHTLLELNSALPLFRYFLDARPGHEVWAFAHTQRLGTIAPVRKRVLQGAGVAVLPHYFVKDDLQQGRLKPIMQRVQMPVDWFRLIWKVGHPREQQLRTLAATLGQWPLR